MSRENYALRLTSLEDKEPIYIVITSIFAFKKVIPEEKSARAYGKIFSTNGAEVDVVEVPQEILQVARTTGVLTAIPN